MPSANRDRLLVHLHGGGYVLYPGEAGAGEAMLMAGHGRFKVVSVDYRMPPDFPFPAALDDAIAVWRALLADRDPRRMAVLDRKSTRLNSSHANISYAVFCLKKKKR